MLGLPLTFAAPLVLRRSPRCRRSGCSCGSRRRGRGGSTSRRCASSPTSAGARDAGPHALVAAAAPPRARGAAHPRGRRPGLEPGARRRPARGPLLLVVDNGWAAAHDWRERLALAVERRRGGRAARAAPSPSSPPPTRPARSQPVDAGGRARAAARLQAAAASARPRARISTPIGRFLDARRRTPRSSGSATASAASTAQAFVEGLAAHGAGARASPSSRPSARRPLALAGAENAAGAAHRRASCAPSRTGATAAPCAPSTSRACRSPRRRFAFDAGATEAEARFDLPIELRNAIARLEILGEGSAGAVALSTSAAAAPRRPRLRRHGRPGAAAARADLLRRPRARALRRGRARARGGVADAVAQLIDEQVSVLILADVGTLDRETLAQGRGLRREGRRCSCASPARASPPATTTSCRCACAAAAAASAARCPGRRRARFAPFTRESPFVGLPVAGRDRRQPPGPRRARRRPRRARPGRRSPTARRSSPPTSAARA